ncbi:MAG: phosphonopyruvate decarboxylase [Oscillospiraceae bacterium]|nr:phosphonopyruvate decarboxylase [Oscillospiraceae bacterium]
MRAETFTKLLNSEFFTGVPDSQLSPFCSYLMNTCGVGGRHIIAANEGNAAALAAGYHLATGKTPVVYLQNSGIGNIVNPLASLLNEKVYGIPCIFVVGWRGEPGVHDELQHVYQGEVTLRLLEDMQVSCFVVRGDTTPGQLAAKLEEFKPLLQRGKQVAFVIAKGALEYSEKFRPGDAGSMLREELIRRVTAASEEDIVISTTGKTSRELFELRKAAGQPHKYDFLTVGSMGHSSSIALGLALQKPSRRVWCIDGDGAALMHMGAMALIGQSAPRNLIHILINNAAHESVGGLPTVAGGMDWVKIAEGCGYPFAASASDYEELERALKAARERGTLCFIEAKCAAEARADLGRPTSTPKDNKEELMAYLASRP